MLSLGCLGVQGADELAANFRSPPNESKPWCYWWWLNGAASKEGITRDFEEMRKQGISGALLFDAGEAGPEAPRGPKFMSAEWRELYKHAVREADRCGIVLGVNLCSGWNAGGPWVNPEYAAKKLVAAETMVRGPGRLSVALPKPAVVQGYYRDIAVLAMPTAQAGELRASSQYQNYGPALAEDGDEESRWVSNGDKPGMGPTPDKPEFLKFDFVEPWTAAGLFLK
ncbi:MAG: glycosyl hydrolase, partial [Verrucomicrobia bacterium]|nr:glycosyl hydrolase [Verrucomicrobiota bacterium]